jgi:hypothetical protein
MYLQTIGVTHMNKIRKNYRLKPTLVKLIQKTGEKTGRSNTSIVEHALSEYFIHYEQHGLKVVE